MPYSADHKRRTRAHIVETARKLFNVHGFEGVSIIISRAKNSYMRRLLKVSLWVEALNGEKRLESTRTTSSLKWIVLLAIVFLSLIGPEI